MTVYPPYAPVLEAASLNVGIVSTMQGKLAFRVTVFKMKLRMGRRYRYPSARRVNGRAPLCPGNVRQVRRCVRHPDMRIRRSWVIKYSRSALKYAGQAHMADGARVLACALLELAK